MQVQQMAMLVAKVGTLRSVLLPQRSVAVAVAVAQVLQQRALAVAEAVSAQRVQALVRLVLTEAVTVAMVLLQQASVP